ncbi:glutamate 5-kinase domain-containing protein [Cystoisospora suis]|uniref:Glutamate 5-kinase domain-containing protein n=1 Tax=Cystoisospora suis TaxID=483139 RepID=A0A2C6KX65_9APIC|nr:glutamate 5-kinase domain-containing protein [Cystoisospora suis]
MNVNLSNLGRFVDTVCKLRAEGHVVVVVSSGAVGVGCVSLRLKERPERLNTKQALAAVGQCRLMRLYEDLFSIREEKVAQLLLSRHDLLHPKSYQNFRSALRALLSLEVIPIINENDSLATEELRFGDNDTLAAHIAVAVDAHWLFILTDVDCLFDKNPHKHRDARPVAFVDRLTDVYAFLSDGDCGAWGTGGMYTKVVASKIATNVGVHVAISNGQHPERILDILQYAERSYEVDEEEQEDHGGCGTEGRHVGGRLFPRIPPPRSVLGMTSRRGGKDGGSKQSGLPLSSPTSQKSPADDYDEHRKRKDSLSHEEITRNKEGKKPTGQSGGVEDSDHHRRNPGEPEEGEEARLLTGLPSLSLPPSSSSTSSRLPSSCDGVSCAVSVEGEKGEREEGSYYTRRRSSVSSSIEGVKGEGEEGSYLTRRRSSVCSSIDGGIYGGGWQDEDDEDERKSESLFGASSLPLCENRRHSVGGEEASQGSECPSPLVHFVKERAGGEQGEQEGLPKTREEGEPRDQRMSRHDEGPIKTCNGKGEGSERREKDETSVLDNETLYRKSDATGVEGDFNGQEAQSSVTPSGVSNVRSPQQQPFSSLTVCSKLDEMPFLGTIFLAKDRRLHRKGDTRGWILSMPVRGKIFVDPGAVQALVQQKKSLFAAGVRHVSGSFASSECVAIYINHFSRPHTKRGTCGKISGETSDDKKPLLQSNHTDRGVTLGEIEVAISDSLKTGRGEEDGSRPVSSPANSSPKDNIEEGNRRGGVGGGTAGATSMCSSSPCSSPSPPVSCSPAPSYSRQTSAGSFTQGHPHHSPRRRCPTGGVALQVCAGSSSSAAGCCESCPLESLEIARCITNFSSEELKVIKGKKSSEFRSLLGYPVDEEVAHRQHIVFTFMNGYEELRNFCLGIRKPQ